MSKPEEYLIPPALFIIYRDYCIVLKFKILTNDSVYALNNLTILRPVSTRNIRKLKGTTSSIGNSLFISIPSNPNLNRNVFHIKKKNQNIRQKCIIT